MAFLFRMTLYSRPAARSYVHFDGSRYEAPVVEIEYVYENNRIQFAQETVKTTAVSRQSIITTFSECRQNMMHRKDC